jgi:phosphatidylserine/phosphatidylglycerophosphate/cardiolipin synthase-like enzyme
MAACLLAWLLMPVSNVQAAEVQPGGTLEVAFSPNGGAEELAVRVIDSARSSVRMLSYTFTSPAITKALVRARVRGVSVALVADARNNLQEDRSGRAHVELSRLVDAGCDVRVIAAFPLQHDKLLIADSVTTELGSFNYTSAANRRNSETMLVVWNNLDLAQQALGHFQRNYALSTPFRKE